MIEVIITAKLLDSAEPDIIGIKEALASVVEEWIDCISIDVRASAPLQLTFEDKPEIRQKVTVAAVVEELKKRNLTIEEYRNIEEALIELTRIDR